MIIIVEYLPSKREINEPQDVLTSPPSPRGHPKMAHHTMGNCQHDSRVILNNCWVSPRVLLLCHNVHDSKTINNNVTGFQVSTGRIDSPVGCSKWFCGMFEVVLEWLRKKIFTVLESITCSSTHMFSPFLSFLSWSLTVLICSSVCLFSRPLKSRVTCSSTVPIGTVSHSYMGCQSISHSYLTIGLILVGSQWVTCLGSGDVAI